MYRHATSIFILILLFSNAPAQRGSDPGSQQREVAQQELEAVLLEAGKLPEKLPKVNVTSQAAGLLSFTDPTRSESIFLEVWNDVKTAADKGLDKQRAQTLILQHLFARNPKLAKRLMNEEAGLPEPSLAERATGRAPHLRRAATLASALVDSNPRAASEILEQTLPGGMTVAGLNSLVKLREQNPLLSDFVTAKVMTGLRNQPDVVSLSGLQLISAYLFPEGQSVELTASLQTLRVEFFANAYDALRASLTQTDAALVKELRYSDSDLRFRALYQARMAMTLAALAPRYRPDLHVELDTMANKLGTVLPPNAAQLAKIASGRLSGNFSSEDPDQRFVFALSNGDFDSARNEIDRIKDADKRSAYTQLLIKSEARAFLAKSELMEAVIAIRKLDDPNARLVMYMDAIKAAKSKRDADVLKVIINEARLLIPQTARNGLHLRALLSFTSQLAKLGATDDALEFLKGAVSTINALGSASNEESASKSLADAAMAELNDPNSLLDEPLMEHAFVGVGLLDLELGLTQARRIQPKPIQLLARLQTIQSVIKQAAIKPKPAASPAKVAPPPNAGKP